MLGWRGSPGSPGEIVAMHSKVSVEGLDGARAGVHDPEPVASFFTDRSDRPWTGLSVSGSGAVRLTETPPSPPTAPALRSRPARFCNLFRGALDPRYDASREARWVPRNSGQLKSALIEKPTAPSTDASIK